MKIRYENGVSELVAARKAMKYGLLADYIYCRRMGYSILEALDEWDLI